MVGWHHQFIGPELEQILKDGEDRAVWCAAVHGVEKSWTQLGDLTATKSFEQTFRIFHLFYK